MIMAKNISYYIARPISSSNIPVIVSLSNHASNKEH